jgi:hypothetical protein
MSLCVLCSSGHALPAFLAWHAGGWRQPRSWVLLGNQQLVPSHHVSCHTAASRCFEQANQRFVRLHCLQVLVLMAGLLPDAETAVAVMGLSTQLSLLPWMFCYSLGTATATRVAQALGGGSALRASRILRCGVAAHGYSDHYYAVHSSLCRLLKYASRTAYYVAAAGNFSAVRY